VFLLIYLYVIAAAGAKCIGVFVNMEQGMAAEVKDLGMKHAKLEQFPN
jgi:hypothetical protein